MFGYVKVNVPELKVKEYEYYCGTYCGLCRSMGRCTGQCSRMTLNYDFVFLAVLRIALEDTVVSFEQKRCLAHPLNKRNSMVKNEALDYCAATSAILNYQKITDDISDERGMKRLKARIVLPFVAHARKKALKRSPELRALDTTVSDKLNKSGRSAMCFEIITDYPNEISDEIIFTLNHSCTLIPAKGMYSGRETNMLICVVNKTQVAAISAIVRRYPNTFAIMDPVSEVMGNFKRMDSEGKEERHLLDSADGKAV